MSSHLNPSPRGAVLEHTLVEELMREGVIDCAPETDLPTVARMMAVNNVHAVVVRGTEPPPGGGEDLTWGIVTALDLVAAALPGAGAPDAGTVASTEVVTVDAQEPLERAAQLMVEHQLTHLLVVVDASPVGILSTLDVARWLAANDPEGGIRRGPDPL